MCKKQYLVPENNKGYPINLLLNAYKKFSQPIFEIYGLVTIYIIYNLLIQAVLLGSVK